MAEEQRSADTQGDSVVIGAAPDGDYSTNEIVVYTIRPCPYCESAKALLQSRGISYREVFVNRDDTATREALLKRSGMRTFPQIFHGNQLIGGFTDLERLDREKGLSGLKTSS